MKVCDALFEKIEIDHEGETYFCCEGRVARHSIGNIYKQDFNDVWNSDIAVKMREAALEGEYPYCNAKICHKLVNNINNHFCDQKEYFKPIMDKYPIQISFPIDQDCNAKCIFCRDKIVSATQEELDDLRYKLDNYFLPICKDVEYLTVNNLGDAFSSKFSREFIKKVSQNYPDVRFIIMTNGICATENMIKELGIENKIKEFDVSINAVKAKTHKNIFRNNGFKNLIENLKYIAKLKKENKIENLNFNFVICSYNWREMKSFIRFALKHNAKINFWEVRDYYNNSLENKYTQMAVHLPTHKDYKKFKHYITSNVFDNPNIVLSPIIKDLRNEAIRQNNNSIFNKFINKLKIKT